MTENILLHLRTHVYFQDESLLVCAERHYIELALPLSPFPKYSVSVQSSLEVRRSRGRNNGDDIEDAVDRQNGSDVVRLRTKPFTVRVARALNHEGSHQYIIYIV